MSDTTNPQNVSKPKISEESARQAVIKMFEAFEIPIEDEDERTHEKRPNKFIPKLAAAVQRGRLEIKGEGDDIEIIQHLRKQAFGQKYFKWEWSRLGMGKARVRIGADGVVPFGQAYTVAAPMIGYDAGDIQTLHPVDLTLVEDIAGFFQEI